MLPCLGSVSYIKTLRSDASDRRRSSCGLASAADAISCILTMVAGQQGMFSRSRRNSEARRLLSRKCPISSAVNAISVGPDCPVGTPVGSSAHVIVPHRVQ